MEDFIPHQSLDQEPEIQEDTPEVTVLLPVRESAETHTVWNKEARAAWVAKHKDKFGLLLNTISYDELKNRK